MRTRIKICGITRPEDARTAARLGADAIGLVFYEHSPRRIALEEAARIVGALPPFVASVALFVDAEDAIVRDVLETIRVDLLQFHGSEPPAYCAGFGVPYIKAVRMREGVDVRTEAQRYADAAALLVDAWHPQSPGGTGRSFEWAPLPDGLGVPVVLAGGLTADNVARAMDIVRPWGVDVSSGVESSGGIKDGARMRAFVRAVMRADETRAEQIE